MKRDTIKRIEELSDLHESPDEIAIDAGVDAEVVAEVLDAENETLNECEQCIFMNDFDPCMFCGKTIEEYEKENEDLPKGEHNQNMTFKEALKILDALHNKYPKLKKMSAQATADFVRTLPAEEHDPVNEAANFIAHQSFKDVILRVKKPGLN